MLELRRLAEVDLDDVIAQDERAFALNYDLPSRLAVTEDLTAMVSAWALIDGGDVVGFAGARRQELTVAPGHTMAMYGLTWVSVAPSHRRQGLAARLIEAVRSDAIDAGAATMGLIASEGGIYTRFGYGPATFLRQVEIDRRSVRFRSTRAPVGRVRYLEISEAVRRGSGLYERYRLSQVGAVSRSEVMWAILAHRLRDAYWVAHEDPAGELDGLAAYTIEHRWAGSRPAYVLKVADLFAATPAARHALLGVLLTTDLVATITTNQLPLDDPLDWELEDRRAISTTDQRDMLWLAPLDVPAMLSALRPSAAGEPLGAAATAKPVVLDVVGAGHWAVQRADQGVVVEATAAAGDLTLGMSEFGSIALGGAAPSALVLAGRAEASSRDALARADALFRPDRLPFCNTMF